MEPTLDPLRCSSNSTNWATLLPLDPAQVPALRKYRRGPRPLVLLPGAGGKKKGKIVHSYLTPEARPPTCRGCQSFEAVQVKCKSNVPVRPSSSNWGKGLPALVSTSGRSTFGVTGPKTVGQEKESAWLGSQVLGCGYVCSWSKSEPGSQASFHPTNLGRLVLLAFPSPQMIISLQSSSLRPTHARAFRPRGSLFAKHFDSG